MTSHSDLRSVFEKARQTENIDEIYGPLLASNLYVFCKKTPPNDELAYFIQKSPTADRWSVTVSEQPVKISNVDFLKCTGLELLNSVNGRYEVVVAYPDGGDYLTLEQIAYFVDKLKEETV